MQAVAIAMRGKNKTGQTKRGNQFRKICSTEDPLKQNTGKNGVCGEMLGRQNEYFGEGSAVRMWPVTMFLQDEQRKMS